MPLSEQEKMIQKWLAVQALEHTARYFLAPWNLKANPEASHEALTRLWDRLKELTADAS